MNTLMKILITIDNALSNYFMQGCLFGIILISLRLKSELSLNFDGITFVWVISGLICYFILMGVRLVKDKDYKKELKETFKTGGFLPFLKGFNYCVLLGVLSFGLFALLNSEPKK